MHDNRNRLDADLHSGREIIRFAIRSGGRIQLCEMSYETLDDVFGDSEDRLARFIENQDAIEQLACRKANKGLLEGGFVVLRHEDLDRD